MPRRGETKYGNLVGKRYGRLLVVAMHPKYVIECKCDCGAVLSIRLYNVTSGRKSSCGCLLRDSRARNGSRNAKDIKGKKFGLLTAIERVTRPGECRAPRWRFACDCGNEKILGGHHVSCGQIVSCGCRLGRPTRSQWRRKCSASYARMKRLGDERYILRQRIGNAIRKSLSKTVSKKVAKWEKLLGYSAADLRAHLQATLPPGHTWEDFLSGKLHIDHKRPLASFVFSSAADPDFLAAWSMRNLQLLTAEDNMHKHDKWNPSERDEYGSGECVFC